MLFNLFQKMLRPNEKLKIPLRLILTLPFVLLTVGTTVNVSYLSLQNSQRSINSLANQLMTEVSDRIHLYLNSYFKTSDLIVRFNARAIKSGQVDITKPKSLELYFLDQIQEFGSARIHFINPQGGLVGAGNDERGLTVSLTENFIQGRLYVYSVDSQGKRKKLLVNQQNYNASQRPFYQKALLAGKPTWTPIFVYVPATRGLGIAFSYPFYNQKQQLQGVLASDITLVTISEFLKKSQISTHGQVFIIEKSGLMVASSTPEYPFLTGGNGTQNKRLNAVESKEPLVRLAVQHLLSRGNLTQIKTAQQLEFELEGKRQFLLVTPYNDQLGLDWLVVTVVPESDFMAEVDANRHLTVLLSCGALAGAITLGLLLTQFIVRPMQRLGQASLALADGEWNQAIEQDSLIAEIRVLSRSFNWMSQQLGQSYDRVKIALQESEERFTKVFRTCPEAMGVFTLDGQCVDVNDALIDLYGYSREELIGRPLTKIKYWVNLEDRQRYLQDLLSGKKVHNQEFAVRHKTGRILTVLFSADIIELQGQPHIIAVTKNISDVYHELRLRKQAELELRQQKDLRETIYNESADALFLVAPKTLLITDCNYRAVELFEADTKDKLIGIKGHTFGLHPFTSGELSEITTQMDRKGFWSLEIEYISQKGNHFWGNLAAKEVAIADQVIYLVRVTDITERKQIEETLRQSEARFQQLSAASPGIIYTIEEYPARPVRFEYLSQAFEEIHEIPLAEALKDPAVAFDSFHPDDRAGHQQAVIRSIETMQPFKHEWRIITPSGKIKWVQANSRPERRENGVLVWHGVMLEISDRKRIEEALRQSEARFQKIAGVSPAQIYILVYYPDTSEMRFEYISPEVREIQELSPEEVLENPLLTYNQVHPDDLALYNQLTTQSFKTLESFAHEWRIITPSGKIKWVRANSRPERRENGEIAWYGVLLDITDLKQAEAALRKSEERFRHAFDDAPIGMALLGLDNRWLQINPMLREMLDYTDLEFFSLKVFEIVHPEDVDQLRHCIEQVLSNENRSIQVELRYLCNDGRIAWGLTSLSLVKDFHNQPLYYVAQIQDITEQHAIEQMKNEFISIVSHELRTPLTAIQGFLGLLNTGIYDNKPEKAKRMLQQALTNSDRLVHLVNDILDLERLSSGQVEIVKEVCNAADLMQRAIEGVQSIADQATVTLAITLTTACVWASGDLIIQTLTNLLSNAIKFSGANSVITLSAQPQSDWVLFQVKDQGRGIPADKLETIFERFQQVDISDARAKGGTGLGLAICQSIIKQHDGGIWAESTLGEGSTFYFTLPIPPAKP